MRPELCVELLLEDFDRTSLHRAPGVKLTAAADDIRMHKNLCGVSNTNACIHHYRHGASLVASRCEPVK
jgi:hypothetical protein